jgi:hypothetical protein
MQKLLLQNTTGAVYPWSESLAKRKDMVDYEPTKKEVKTSENVEDVSNKNKEKEVVEKEVLTTKSGKKSNEVKVES